MLLKGWKDGKSTAETAATIPGKSRESVIGRFHRLRFDGTIPMGSKWNRQTNNKKSSLKSPSEPRMLDTGSITAIPKIEAVTKGINTIDIEDGMCRFPMWRRNAKEEDKVYCAEPTSGKSPYCEYHEKICYAGVSRMNLPKDIN